MHRKTDIKHTVTLFLAILLCCSPILSAESRETTSPINRLQPEDVEQVELLIATPSFVSLASMAGHMSLLFRLRGNRENHSPVISFMADSVDKNGILQEGFPYVFNGIFGQYRNVIQEEILNQLAYRHNKLEGRDIYRLTLKLTRGQIGKLIHRIRKIKTKTGERYFFFNKNCTSFMVHLLNDVLPKTDRIPDRESIDMPLVVGSYLVRKGLAHLEETGYRWFSKESRLQSFQNSKDWKEKSIRSGYSLFQISPSFQLSDSSGTPSISFKMATYHQHMGDKSIFSLGPETELDLFLIEGKYYFTKGEKEARNLTWDMEIKMIRFDRLMIPKSRKETTWFNHGIGMELFALTTDHYRGIQSDFSPFHLTYYLNLFEVNKLSHFLNLGFGWGLSQQKYQNANHNPDILHFTDFTTSLRAKIQLPGNNDNIIRCGSRYKARWAQDRGLLSEWVNSLEIQWHIQSNDSIIIKTGIRHDFNQYHFNYFHLSDLPGHRVSIYVSFCHFGNIFPTLGDIKSILSGIF